MFKKIGWYTFFLLYIWAKYEIIWSNVTAQSVTLGANFLVKPKPYIKTPSVCYFFYLKVAFTKDIFILKMAKAFEIWFFFAILNYVKIPKRVKNVPIKFKQNK